MTDAHCHIEGDNPSIREFVIGRDFVGVHPWESAKLSHEEIKAKIENLRLLLTSHPERGVGEIGLDRLKEREISPQMRELFEDQLKLAFELHRSVVLHGAKCWGQVVKTIQALIKNPNQIPFLFHGFSRSDGLIPDIVALNGYISVGPAVLNDHAVNYQKLVQKIPLDRLLLETDRMQENADQCPSLVEVATAVAHLRGLSISQLETRTDQNAKTFICYTTQK